MLKLFVRKEIHLNSTSIYFSYSGNHHNASESMDRSMIGKPSKANQMLRSNSSHGGFSGINSQNNASVTKSPSNNQVRKLRGLHKKF